NDCEFVGIPLHLDNEKMTKSDRDLIVELSRTVAKLNRRIDALEERAEMNEEDIEKWGRRTVEADYKAGQALINTKLTKEGVDRERSEEHTSELQSRFDLVCRLLLEKKKNKNKH